MSRAHYLGAALLDRASGLGPVAELQERRLAARAARAGEAAGPAPDGLPIPPAALRARVWGRGDAEVFVRSSGETAELIRSTVEAETPMEGLGRILDFGCGCGRVARAWAGLEGPELHGCDYNPDGVEWCRQNLPFGQFRVNDLAPPAPYPDDQFGLVYAISVLTHLPEELAQAWIADWRRILVGDGLLLVTTHGDRYRDALGRRGRVPYDAGRPVVRHPRRAGANACVAHHPRGYVEGTLLAGFEVLSFRPGDDTFGQDVYLARPR